MEGCPNEVRGSEKNRKLNMRPPQININQSLLKIYPSLSPIKVQYKLKDVSHALTFRKN